MANEIDALIFEPNHAEVFLDEMQGRLATKELIEDLIRALCVGIQEFEDITYDYAVSWMLDSASGYLLNRIGAFVGAQRLGLSNSSFRRIIRARIAALRSNGLIGDIANVVVALVDPSLLVYSTAYPAGFRFYFEHDGNLTSDERRRFARITELARPAGVSGSYVEAAGDDISTFRFDRDPGFGRLFSRLVE